jgi:CheY-like chemotaxis protein
MAHVLLVEMHSDVRALVHAAIESAGFRVSSMDNAADALALLNRERLDAAVIDAELSSMDGVRFASSVADRGVPVLVIAEGAEWQRHLDRTKCLWLPIPIPIQRLLAIIRILVRVSAAQRALIAVRLQRLAAASEETGHSTALRSQVDRQERSSRGALHHPPQSGASGAGPSADSLLVTSRRLGPAQCRAARALLRWSQSDLTRRAAVARKTVVDFETKRRALHRRTREALQRAFEDAGVEFLWGDAPINNSKGVGVFLIVESGTNNDPEDEDAALSSLCAAQS